MKNFINTLFSQQKYSICTKEDHFLSLYGQISLSDIINDKTRFSNINLKTDKIIRYKGRIELGQYKENSIL
ncbi:MAG: hypothetical protein HY738_12900 [Bacteroidia bacterium]|nr:hypothetical protein [Bacteroidia bacterium]